MNVFTINRSELEDRLDPKYILYLKNSRNFKYKVSPLKNFLIEKPKYGTAEPGIVRTNENESRYIRITDIDENGELIPMLGATAKDYTDDYVLHNNDFLFARSGATVGKTYLHKNIFPYECFFAGYMIRVRLDEKKLLPDYLFVYTNTRCYQDWVIAIQRAAAQPNINAEEYANLLIPVPSLDVQKNIVAIYNDAKIKRGEKLQESKNLLESIDTYLLNELGITIAPKDNSLKKRIFTVTFKDITSGRFDPQAYIPSLEQLRAELKKTEFKYLKDVVTESNILTKDIGESDVYVGLENIESCTGDYISVSEKESMSFALCFEKGHILFPKLRPYLNKVHLAEFKGICSTEFHVFNAINIDVNFLHFCLLSKITLAQTENLMTGNTLPRLQSSDIANIMIPYPSLSKQKEIAEHIKQIREQAKKLQKEAEEILSNAKQQVEKMILGE